MTPWTIAHKAPLSMGFSRQEYWNGLPCPPPGDLPNPGIEPKSPALQADSLLSEPSGKPKNTGVGSLALLQGNCPTRGSNPGLPHCRWILYQLSHQRSPIYIYVYIYNYNRYVCVSHSVMSDSFMTPWTHCSLTGSPVRGILQARILEWGAISSSSGCSQPRD